MSFPKQVEERIVESDASNASVRRDAPGERRVARTPGNDFAALAVRGSLWTYRSSETSGAVSPRAWIHRQIEKGTMMRRSFGGQFVIGAIIAGLAWSVSSMSAMSAVSQGDAIREGKSRGERYPDLRLPTLDGDEVVALSSFRGKKVLLLAFASW